VANLLPKLEILTVLGAVFPHFCPNKREIWHGGADLLSAAPCQISPIFGPLSKNNTGMAALRAGLPVKRVQFFETQCRPINHLRSRTRDSTLLNFSA